MAFNNDDFSMYTKYMYPAELKYTLFCSEMNTARSIALTGSSVPKFMIREVFFLFTVFNYPFVLCLYISNYSNRSFMQQRTFEFVNERNLCITEELIQQAFRYYKPLIN